MPAVDLSTYGGSLLDVGYQGQVVDQNTASIISRTNESATAIDFGTVVVRGATDNACKPIASTTDSILGFAVRHPTRPSLTAPGVTPDLKYQRYESLPIMEIGRIFATAGGNVTRGNPVWVDATTGALFDATSAGRAQVPGAFWDTTTTTGNLGIVRIAK